MNNKRKMKKKIASAFLYVGSRKTQKYILLLFLSYLSWASNYLE
jgi:hypothetical protein